ncbi:MAG: CBS domain-containing protein [Deltaproteobacteria bacterium]|nr:MAG: CBS domain-containing protein [Deltaproteobacteria bacterium]
MLVKNWMSTNVITVNQINSMEDAMGLIKKHKIKMLPVLNKNKLVGIVTDRDLKRASASDATSLEIHELLYLITKIKVQDIMSIPPITIPDGYTVEEAAEVLLKNNISGAPVVDNNGQIMGVITQNDIFRVLISLTGVGKKGVQFAFQLDDRPGSIKEVADIIRAYGGRMVSILSSYEGLAKGYHKVYIRMDGIDGPKLDELEEELRQKASVMYVVNNSGDKRAFRQNQHST